MICFKQRGSRVWSVRSRNVRFLVFQKRLYMCTWQRLTRIYHPTYNTPVVPWPYALIWKKNRQSCIIYSLSHFLSNQELFHKTASVGVCKSSLETLYMTSWLYQVSKDTGTVDTIGKKNKVSDFWFYAALHCLFMITVVLIISEPTA